jgi:inosine-uridine nucleoside N-ribohydrolase
MVRVHMDTDLGGDPDDACALAFLLGWPKYRVAS